jgi:threonine/homoserine/homoserine lactone efflux protein
MTPYLTYASALAIAAVIPGPGVAALVGQALGQGLRAALWFLIGITLGDVAYLTIAVLGLAALTSVFAGALVVIKAAGGAYLVFLGYRFWTSQSGLIAVQRATRASDLKTLSSGFALTMGNPKTIVFYLALLPAVMDLGRVDAAQWAGMAALTVIVLLVTLSPYVLLANRARNALRDPRAQHRLARAAGLIIGGAGAVILIQAAMRVL